MTDPWLRASFALALKLRITHGELCERMSVQEFQLWMAFFAYEREGETLEDMEPEAIARALA